jgi:hypothetical protein
MIEIENETFWGAGAEIKAAYEGMTLRSCAFNQCHIARRNKPGDWTKISNITVTDASQWNCSLDTAAIEAVSLHNLKRTGEAPLFLWGCVFSRVKLSGRISAIKINRSIGIEAEARAAQSAWDRAMVDYYASLDWALDITEAQFPGGVQFEAVPGRLIRRNPRVQALVLRQKLENADLSTIDFQGTALDLSLSGFLQNSLFDSVAIAARVGKWAKRDLEVISMLRSAGIAEPD